MGRTWISRNGGEFEAEVQVTWHYPVQLHPSFGVGED